MLCVFKTKPFFNPYLFYFFNIYIPTGVIYTLLSEDHSKIWVITRTRIESKSSNSHNCSADNSSHRWISLILKGYPFTSCCVSLTKRKAPNGDDSCKKIWQGIYPFTSLFKIRQKISFRFRYCTLSLLSFRVTHTVCAAANNVVFYSHPLHICIHGQPKFMCWELGTDRNQWYQELNIKQVALKEKEVALVMSVSRWPM